ncbi:PITH domain-containing protein [Haematococcus lacustris]|uniref:PITH domain-containing protein n=1 Tax=Haematococcus lacustris TaxID=44745 RepID=A0A699ZAX0_HAELA|nr:PITH domain-containing protein [Haematococcus lacustris]
MPPKLTACCAHDHDCDAADCGPAYSLHKHIDLSHVRCLNEELAGSCQAVFDGAVKLRAICVIGGGAGSSPSQLKVYTNRDNLDFEAVGALPAVQEWDLQAENPGGVLEYPTQ